ncbi:MAG TPA: IS481 family transposase [Bryobacteraceae bacterium]|nr:IS481 family transposase [Bryobacteraceae bacterium]
MDYHYHARLTIHRREELATAVVQGRLGLNEAAAEFKLSRQSASKWVARFRQQGRDGLRDRSSRPHRSPRRTGLELSQRVETLRRLRWTGIRIAQATGLSRSTVSRILTGLRLNKTHMLEPAIPILRYEHAAPGDLLHIDIKKLARIHKPGHRLTGNPRDETRHAGWEFLYVAIDDHSRIAFTALLPDEKAVAASAFLRQAIAFFARLGITIRRVLTDNGPCFCSRLFLAVCRQFHITPKRTRFYTPRTNGKAERFIQTAIREWAYARLYQNSAERASHLPDWIHQYNWHRPHTSLDHQPPISRSALDVNNLLTHHI